MGRTTGIVVMGVLLGLAACGDQEEGEAASTVTETTTATATVTQTVEAESDEAEVAEPVETGASEGTDATVIDIGEEVDLPSAEITIMDVEQVDSLAEGRIQPDKGESLWLVSMEWTNTSNEAVAKVCHGPYAVDLEVYDTEDREMLDSSDSGFILDPPARIRGGS